MNFQECRKPILVIIFFLISLQSGRVLGTAQLNACDEKNPNICASIQLPKNIDFENSQNFQIKFKSDVDIENLEITIWMPLCTTSKEGGMYSPPPTIVNLEANKYEVKEAYFLMPGAWEIIATFTIREETHQIKFVFLL